MGSGQLGRLNALLICGFQIAVSDVLHHRPGEEVGVLEHDAKRPAKIRLADFVDVDVVVADLAVGNVIKPVQQVCDGGFACAGGSHKGYLLPRLGVEGHIVEHRLARLVGEVYLRHGDVALQLRIGDGALCLVGVFPGPEAGVLRALFQAAVCFAADVDQGDVTAVLLRLCIHQLKNTLRSGQGHDNGVDLVGDLADGLVEATGQKQKAHQGSHGHTAAPAHEPGPGYGHQNILQVAQIVVHGTHHAGVHVGSVGIGAESFIEPVEIRLGGFLVAEYLDHLLPLDHLLNIAVYRAQGLLLPHKESAGHAGELLRGKQSSHQSHQDHSGEDGAGEEHGGKHRNEGHNG